MLTFVDGNTDILRELLPSEIVDNFEIVRFEKTAERFDIWFDEKKIQEDADPGTLILSRMALVVTKVSGIFR